MPDVLGPIWEDEHGSAVARGILTRTFQKALTDQPVPDGLIRTPAGHDSCMIKDMAHTPGHEVTVESFTLIMMHEQLRRERAITADLLAALKLALDQCEIYYGYYEGEFRIARDPPDEEYEASLVRIRTAIAHAEGRTHE